MYLYICVFVICSLSVILICNSNKLYVCLRKNKQKQKQTNDYIMIHSMIQNGKAQLFHKWVSMCLIGWSDFLFQQWLVIWSYGVSIDFMVHISEKKKRMKICFFSILLNFWRPSIIHPIKNKTMKKLKIALMQCSRNVFVNCREDL